MFSYLLKLLTMGTIALVVMSCAGKTESYRYELTSALDTQLSGRHFVARRRGGLEDPKRKVSMYGLRLQFVIAAFRATAQRASSDFVRRTWRRST